MVDFPLSPKARRCGNGYIDVCPAHEDRTPSLSISEGKDGKILLHCFAGCGFDEIIGAAGLSNQKVSISKKFEGSTHSVNSTVDRINHAISIWNTTQPIVGSIAETYLKSRCLQTWSSDMRFHPSLYFADDRTERPTLVCAVRREGQIIGIHRTFLTATGEKLGKKMLGPCGGGSVYVGGDGDVTAIAEGIENALSVRIMSGDHRARYFAALSATGMRKLKLPEDRGQLMIFADGDRTGMTAAYELGERASLQGWNANTMIPPKGQDWNDELIAGSVGST